MRCCKIGVTRFCYLQQIQYSAAGLAYQKTFQSVFRRFNRVYHAVLGRFIFVLIPEFFRYVQFITPEIHFPVGTEKEFILLDEITGITALDQLIKRC